MTPKKLRAAERRHTALILGLLAAINADSANTNRATSEWRGTEGGTSPSGISCNAWIRSDLVALPVLEDHPLVMRARQRVERVQELANEYERQRDSVATWRGTRQNWRLHGKRRAG